VEMMEIQSGNSGKFWYKGPEFIDRKYRSGKVKRLGSIYEDFGYALPWMSMKMGDGPLSTGGWF